VIVYIYVLCHLFVLFNNPRLLCLFRSYNSNPLYALTQCVGENKRLFTYLFTLASEHSVHTYLQVYTQCTHTCKCTLSALTLASVHSVHSHMQMSIIHKIVQETSEWKYPFTFAHLNLNLFNSRFEYCQWCLCTV
jgi:hypothetical protein